MEKNCHAMARHDALKQTHTHAHTRSLVRRFTRSLTNGMKKCARVQSSYQVKAKTQTV